MRRRFMFGVGSLGVSAALFLALGAGAVAKPAARPNSKAMHFRCTQTHYNVSYPSTSGFAFGLLNCSKPLGQGLQYNTFNESVSNQQVKLSGTFKDYFDGGAIHATFSVSGTPSIGQITFSGPLRITRGTGAYKNAKGRGTSMCTTRDGGETYTCTTTGTVTF
jgi:hypothetical protein